MFIYLCSNSRNDRENLPGAAVLVGRQLVKRNRAFALAIKCSQCNAQGIGHVEWVVVQGGWGTLL